MDGSNFEIRVIDIHIFIRSTLKGPAELSMIGSRRLNKRLS